jgi:hypothetical protein
MKSSPASDSSPPTPGEQTLPAHASTEKLERDKYLNLARELPAQVVALRGLWKQRDELSRDVAQIVSERAKVCGSFHKAKGEPQKRGMLEKPLEGVNYRHSMKVAEIEGCDAAISESEVALHTRYPLANATFDKLYRALVDWTLEADYQRILALIDPTRIGLEPEIPPHLQPIERTVSQAEFAGMPPVQRAQVQKDPDGRMFIMVSSPALQMNPPEPTLEEMAQKMARSCRGSVGLEGLRLPPAWVRSLTDEAWVKWSTMRKDTLQDLCKVTEELCDKAISILERVEQAQGFRVPVFKLGPDEMSSVQPDVPLPWLGQSPVTYLSEEEIRRKYVWKGPEESKLSPHMEELLRNAGKTRSDLTAASYDVLVHSEISQSQSVKAGSEIMGSHAAAVS